MSGTRQGAARAVATIKEKDPDFYKRIGQLGGRKGTSGGYYYAKLHYSEDDPRHPKNAGYKGGKLSKRSKK